MAYGFPFIHEETPFSSRTFCNKVPIFSPETFGTKMYNSSRGSGKGYVSQIEIVDICVYLFREIGPGIDRRSQVAVIGDGNDREIVERFGSPGP